MGQGGVNGAHQSDGIPIGVHEECIRGVWPRGVQGGCLAVACVVHGAGHRGAWVLRCSGVSREIRLTSGFQPWPTESAFRTTLYVKVTEGAAPLITCLVSVGIPMSSTKSLMPLGQTSALPDVGPGCSRPFCGPLSAAVATVAAVGFLVCSSTGSPWDPTGRQGPATIRLSASLRDPLPRAQPQRMAPHHRPPAASQASMSRYARPTGLNIVATPGLPARGRDPNAGQRIAPATSPVLGHVPAAVWVALVGAGLYARAMLHRRARRADPQSTPLTLELVPDAPRAIGVAACTGTRQRLPRPRRALAPLSAVATALDTDTLSGTLELEDEISSGSYGCVYAGRWRAKDDDVELRVVAKRAWTGAELAEQDGNGRSVDSARAARCTDYLLVEHHSNTKVAQAAEEDEMEDPALLHTAPYVGLHADSKGRPWLLWEDINGGQVRGRGGAKADTELKQGPAPHDSTSCRCCLRVWVGVSA